MKGPAKFLVYTLIAGYLLLVGGAIYWQLGQREILAAHPGNPQQLHRRRQVRRGGIYASCGEVIAESLEQSSGFQRVYRGTPGLAPMLGYCSQSLAPPCSIPKKAVRKSSPRPPTAIRYLYSARRLQWWGKAARGIRASPSRIQ
jgi:hypothetical protein